MHGVDQTATIFDRAMNKLTFHKVLTNAHMMVE
jgi:hypothetical protein